MLFQIDQRAPIWSAVASIGETAQDVTLWAVRQVSTTEMMEEIDEDKR